LCCVCCKDGSMEPKVTWRTKGFKQYKNGSKGKNPGQTGKKKSLVSVVYCQVKVSAWGWSLVQRSPTECGVSECDRKASIIRRPWPTRGCCAMGKNMYIFQVLMFIDFHSHVPLSPLIAYHMNFFQREFTEWAFFSSSISLLQDMPVLYRHSTTCPAVKFRKVLRKTNFVKVGIECTYTQQYMYTHNVAQLKS
jgi:hypothetical protein